MGLRRRMYRLSRSHKVWAGTVLVCVLYVNLLHTVFMADRAEREGKQSQRVAEGLFSNDDGERGRTVEGVTGYEGDFDGDGSEGVLDRIMVDNHDNEHDRNYSVNYDEGEEEYNLKNDGNYDEHDVEDDRDDDDDEDVTGDGRNNDNDVADSDDNNDDAHNDAADDSDDNNAAAHDDADDSDDNNAAAHNDAVDSDNANAAAHNAAADSDDNNAAAHNAAADSDDDNAAAHNDTADSDDDNGDAQNDGKKDMEQNPEEFKRNDENLARITDNAERNPDEKLNGDEEEKSIQRDDGEIKEDNVKPEEVQRMNVGDAGAHGNDPVGGDVEDADHNRDAGKQLTYNGYYSRNETVDHKPVVKVLLLTYQRSGSSYVGELLTSGGGAMYVFEPLFVWRKILGPEADARVQDDSARVLGDLLDCRREVIHAWQRKGFYSFRRKPEGAKNFCHDARLRLLKTIRARARFVRPWIQERPDIKVVHLVRDPRGIISSVQRGGGIWSANNRNVDLQCGNIEEDLRLEDLGPNRYLRVRYEDLVDHPLEETRRVFAFMGIDVSQGVMTYLQQHAGLGQPPAEEKGYLNTYRGSNYRHDHWKAHLDNREMEHIQQVCRGVMERLGYTPIPPT